jgi:hypothetical protein
VIVGVSVSVCVGETVGVLEAVAVGEWVGVPVGVIVGDGVTLSVIGIGSVISAVEEGKT